MELTGIRCISDRLSHRSTLVRLVAVADTHNKHAELVVPDGDLFVHAGDLTLHGSLDELAAALAWIGRLPHRHKIVVAGNHDRGFERHAMEARALVPDGVVYLEGSGVEVAGLRVWGGPWTARYPRTLWAFELSLRERASRWAQIPPGTDLLVTHMPAAGILDSVDRHQRAGCSALLARLSELPKLRAHIAGHLHEGRGETIRHGVHHVNAACFGADFHHPLRPALVIDL